MDFKELQEATGGWTPPADDLHDSLFAPKHEPARELRGSFEDRNRSLGGFTRSRGSYR